MSEGKIFSAEAVFGLDGWCEFDAVKASDYEELEAELAESKQLITSYQIAKDNLEMRLAKMCLDISIPEYVAAPPPAQVY